MPNKSVTRCASRRRQPFSSIVTLKYFQMRSSWLEILENILIIINILHKYAPQNIYGERTEQVKLLQWICFIFLIKKKKNWLQSRNAGRQEITLGIFVVECLLNTNNDNHYHRNYKNRMLINYLRLLKLPTKWKNILYNHNSGLLNTESEWVLSMARTRVEVTRRHVLYHSDTKHRNQREREREKKVLDRVWWAFRILVRWCSYLVS